MPITLDDLDSAGSGIVLPDTGPTRSLVTGDRAAQVSSLASLRSSNPDAFNALLDTASDSVRVACKQYFTPSDYVEYISGAGLPYQDLVLSHFPVISISRVAAYVRPVMEIRNTNLAANQRATSATTESGVRLVRCSSGLETIADFAFSDYVTLSALKTAIEGAGNGWAVTIAGGFDQWASTELRRNQGPYDARIRSADLIVYTEEIGGWAAAGWNQGNFGYRLDAGSGVLFGYFPEGQSNILIKYKAGYTSIPTPIQEATVQLAVDLLQSRRMPGGAKYVKIGPFEVQYRDDARQLAQSPKIMSLIGPFIDHSASLGAAQVNT